VDRFQQRLYGRLGLVEATIRRLPSMMARIPSIAALRNPHTGEYFHPIITRPSQRRPAEERLRALHERYFRAWLRCQLEDQRRDLDSYLCGLGADSSKVAEAWLTLETYRSLIPASATAAERRLFCRTLEALLRLVLAPGRKAGGDEIRDASGEEMLTTQEVAGWLRVSPRTVRCWAETGRLRAVKVGRQWRFRPSDVERSMRFTGDQDAG